MKLINPIIYLIFIILLSLTNLIKAEHLLFNKSFSHSYLGFYALNLYKIFCIHDVDLSLIVF